MRNNFNIIKNLMTEYDRPFYVYDEKTICSQIEKLSQRFSHFEFLYSIKTNPFAPIVNCIASNGFGGDAASSEEVFISQRAGMSYEKILYSASGKTRKDIEKTLDKSIIIADSYNELITINDIAKERNLHVKVGLRINPDYNMDMGKGETSKFGVDEETLVDNKDLFNKLENIRIIGIHVHVRSQVLDHNKLCKYYEDVFELALFCKDTMNWDLEFINFGGGLGIAYSLLNDTPLDIDTLSKECEDLFIKYKSKLNIRLIIETGRFVVCDAGQYVTHIVDIKKSRGKKYLIVENGLNGFLRPSMVNLIDSYAPYGSQPKSYEPFFTTRDAFDFKIVDKELSSSLEKVDLVGNLCAATDVMAKDIELPKADINDIVVVSKAGSYAYSLTPMLFTSHPIPLQFYVTKSGEIIK